MRSAFSRGARRRRSLSLIGPTRIKFVINAQEKNEQKKREQREKQQGPWRWTMGLEGRIKDVPEADRRK
jgi:hypothetical protein